MAVAVTRPDADDGDPRPNRREQLRRRVARAVMRHLHHVRGQIHARAEQPGLGGQLDVTTQQHPPGRGRGPQHQRGVVDLRSFCLLRWHHVGGVRRQHLDRQPGPRQPPPSLELDDRYPSALGLSSHLLPCPRRHPCGTEPHRADGPVVIQHRVEPANVVGVQVAQHDERHPGHVQPVQAGRHRADFRPGVHHDRTTSLARGEHQRVALPDIAGDHRPPRRRPPRRDYPYRDHHDQQPDEHDADQHPEAPVPQRRHQHERAPGE